MADAQTQIALQVATPLGKALEISADDVQVPSASGEFGVLHGHLPLLAALKPGILTYRESGTVKRAAVGGGFVEAGASKVRLITEFYNTADQVDLATAQKDLEAAEERLKAHEGLLGDTAHREAQGALDWAIARIELVAGQAQ